jgi:hypothetical protein
MAILLCKYSKTAMNRIAPTTLPRMAGAVPQALMIAPASIGPTKRATL